MRLILVILLTIQLSCSSDTQHEINTYSFNHSDNFASYQDIYVKANETLDRWIKDSIDLAIYYLTNPHFQIDSCFIFNEDSTLLFTTINRRKIAYPNTHIDNIEDFGGANINGQWYFFL